MGFGFSILASSLLCRDYVYVMVTLLQKLPNHPESDPLEVVRQLKFKIPQKSVESILNSVVPLVETSLARLQSILLFASPTDSAYCLVALYLLSTIGSFFNLLSLITLSWLLAFTAPTVYYLKKDAFDEMFKKMNAGTNQLNVKVMSCSSTNLPRKKNEIFLEC